jgi:hypothetical protein
VRIVLLPNAVAAATTAMFNATFSLAEMPTLYSDMQMKIACRNPGGTRGALELRTRCSTHNQE